MPRTLWINAAELSGDMQAATLLEAVRRIEPDCVAVGMGGRNLEAAGQENLFSIDDLSVMGGIEVVSAIPRVLSLWRRIAEELRRRHPDALVLVDAPDFNFHVAKVACSLGIPVYYFIPPQVWAWRTYRTKFIKKYVSGVFSILPFEVPFYQRHGIRAEYVGNPLVDRIHAADVDGVSPEPDFIGMLPGSRRHEVASLMPVFCKAAGIISEKCPGVRFACLQAPNIDEGYLRSFMPHGSAVRIVSGGEPYRFMRTCSAMMAASGTATLEAALCGTPTVVAYRMNRITACIARRVLKVRYVSLANLIMDAAVFPEMLQEDCTAEGIAGWLLRWRTDADALSAVHTGLAGIAERCGRPGAAGRCAEALLRAMGGRR